MQSTLDGDEDRGEVLSGESGQMKWWKEWGGCSCSCKWGAMESFVERIFERRFQGESGGSEQLCNYLEELFKEVGERVSGKVQDVVEQ